MGFAERSGVGALEWALQHTMGLQLWELSGEIELFISVNYICLGPEIALENWLAILARKAAWSGNGPSRCWVVGLQWHREIRRVVLKFCKDIKKSQPASCYLGLLQPFSCWRLMKWWGGAFQIGEQQNFQISKSSVEKHHVLWLSSS